MNREADRSLLESSAEIATRQYDPADTDLSSEAAAGMAETHELFSDSYMAGAGKGSFAITRNENAMTDEEEQEAE